MLCQLKGDQSERLGTYAFHVDYSTQIRLEHDRKYDAYPASTPVLRHIVQYLPEDRYVTVAYFIIIKVGLQGSRVFMTGLVRVVRL